MHYRVIMIDRRLRGGGGVGMKLPLDGRWSVRAPRRGATGRATIDRRARETLLFFRQIYRRSRRGGRRTRGSHRSPMRPKVPRDARRGGIRDRAASTGVRAPDSPDPDPSFLFSANTLNRLTISAARNGGVAKRTVRRRRTPYARHEHADI